LDNPGGLPYPCCDLFGSSHIGEDGLYGGAHGLAVPLYGIAHDQKIAAANLETLPPLRMALEDSVIEAAAWQRVPYLFPEDVMLGRVENIEKEGVYEYDNPSAVNDQNSLERIVENRHKELHFISIRSLIRS
jgi:hypothetical protein